MQITAISILLLKILFCVNADGLLSFILNLPHKRIIPGRGWEAAASCQRRVPANWAAGYQQAPGPSLRLVHSYSSSFLSITVNRLSSRYAQLYHEQFALTTTIVESFRYVFYWCQFSHYSVHIVGTRPDWRSITRISPSWCGHRLTRQHWQNICCLYRTLANNGDIVLQTLNSYRI